MNRLKSSGTLEPLPLGYNLVFPKNFRGFGKSELLDQLNLLSSILTPDLFVFTPTEFPLPSIVKSPTSISAALVYGFCD